MHKFPLYQYMLYGLKLSDNVFKCHIPAQLTIVILQNYLVTVTPKLSCTSTDEDQKENAHHTNFKVLELVQNQI